jgi:hypothetical protein
MSYQRVPGARLATRYAYAPTVRMEAESEGPTRVVMEYASSTSQESQPPLVTRLIFSRVLEFGWSEFDRGVRLRDHDVAFSLIEITESPLIAAINRRVRERGWDERTLHHYRIAFDDHGGYEVVCAEVTIEEP